MIESDSSTVDYIYDSFGALYNYLSDTTKTSVDATGELISYGSQEKRTYYCFNVDSVKTVFCKLGDESVNTSYRIWNTVKDTNGILECHLELLDYSAAMRSLWDQSALEFKLRDKEFILKCFEAIDECDSDEIKKFLSGIKKTEERYSNEHKNRHALFFNELHNECIKFLANKQRRFSKGQ